MASCGGLQWVAISPSGSASGSGWRLKVGRSKTVHECGGCNCITCKELVCRPFACTTRGRKARGWSPTHRLADLIQHAHSARSFSTLQCTALSAVRSGTGETDNGIPRSRRTGQYGALVSRAHRTFPVSGADSSFQSFHLLSATGFRSMHNAHCTQHELAPCTTQYAPRSTRPAIRYRYDAIPDAGIIRLGPLEPHGSRD